jgi:nitrogen fixation NifU-like protein
MLEDLYQKEIIQLARQSRQRLTLDSPKHSARVDNPLCGDRVTVDLIIEADIVKEISIKVRGCALCEAASELLVLYSVGLSSASLMHTKLNLRDYLSGKQDTPPWTQLSVFKPVKEVPSRHECVLLPFSAAGKAFSSEIV